MLNRCLRQFYSFQNKLNPYLEKRLDKNGLFPLRKVQEKALQLMQKHNNVLINEVDSSGKTLAYLLPILQKLLNDKRQQGSQSGAVIVTISKELSLQIYQKIRQIDSGSKLKVMRSGSLAHYSPVIDQMSKPSEEQDHELIINMMEKNVAESVKWNLTDILITTPKMLYRILEHKMNQKDPLLPQFMVIDEADLILTNKDLMTYTKKNISFLNYFLQKSGKDNMKYILSSPNQSFSEQKYEEYNLPQKNSFWKTDIQESQGHLASLNWFICKIGGQQKDEIKSNKLKTLIYLLQSQKRKRVIIYCDKQSMQSIKTAIVTKTDLKPSQIFANMSTEQRFLTLLNFAQGINNILLSTDLTSRGIDFGKPVDTIISFDVKDPQGQFTRMCRINRPEGQYIALVEQTQKDVFMEMNSGQNYRRYLSNPLRQIIMTSKGEQIQ